MRGVRWIRHPHGRHPADTTWGDFNHATGRFGLRTTVGPSPRRCSPAPPSAGESATSPAGSDVALDTSQFGRRGDGRRTVRDGERGRAPGPVWRARWRRELRHGRLHSSVRLHPVEDRSTAADVLRARRRRGRAVDVSGVHHQRAEGCFRWVSPRGDHVLALALDPELPDTGELFSPSSHAGRSVEGRGERPQAAPGRRAGRRRTCGPYADAGAATAPRRARRHRGLQHYWKEDFVTDLHRRGSPRSISPGGRRCRPLNFDA